MPGGAGSRACGGAQRELDSETDQRDPCILTGSRLQFLHSSLTRSLVKRSAGDSGPVSGWLGRPSYRQ